MEKKFIWLVVSRMALGWLFLYAGVTKLLKPGWSAFFYIKDAKTFHWFYSVLASSNFLPVANWLVILGLTLIGISLITGVLMRLSTILGVVLMLLLYLPILDFPYPNANSFIVDEHIIYATLLMTLFATREMQTWELGSILKRTQFFRKFSKFSAWL